MKWNQSKNWCHYDPDDDWFTWKIMCMVYFWKYIWCLVSYFAESLAYCDETLPLPTSENLKFTVWHKLRRDTDPDYYLIKV